MTDGEVARPVQSVRQRPPSLGRLYPFTATPTHTHLLPPPHISLITHAGTGESSNLMKG